MCSVPVSNRCSRTNVKVICSLSRTSQFVQLAWCHGIVHERSNHFVRPPQYILRETYLKIDRTSSQIQVVCTSTYHALAYGVAEGTVGNLKKALEKVDVPLENLFFGYRRSPGPDGGFKSRFTIESSDTTPREEVLANTQPFDLALALIYRAERSVPCSFQKAAGYQIGDMVLRRHGKQPDGPVFQTRMCLDPFRAVSVRHLRHR